MSLSPMINKEKNKESILQTSQSKLSSNNKEIDQNINQIVTNVSIFDHSNADKNQTKNNLVQYTKNQIKEFMGFDIKEEKKLDLINKAEDVKNKINSINHSILNFKENSNTNTNYNCFTPSRNFLTESKLIEKSPLYNKNSNKKFLSNFMLKKKLILTFMKYDDEQINFDENSLFEQMKTESLRSEHLKKQSFNSKLKKISNLYDAENYKKNQSNQKSLKVSYIYDNAKSYKGKNEKVGLEGSINQNNFNTNLITLDNNITNPNVYGISPSKYSLKSNINRVLIEDRNKGNLPKDIIKDKIDHQEKRRLSKDLRQTFSNINYSKSQSKYFGESMNKHMKKSSQMINNDNLLLTKNLNDKNFHSIRKTNLKDSNTLNKLLRTSIKKSFSRVNLDYDTNIHEDQSSSRKKSKAIGNVVFDLKVQNLGKENENNNDNKNIIIAKNTDNKSFLNLDNINLKKNKKVLLSKANLLLNSNSKEIGKNDNSYYKNFISNNKVKEIDKKINDHQNYSETRHFKANIRSFDYEFKEQVKFFNKKTNYESYVCNNFDKHPQSKLSSFFKKSSLKSNNENLPVINNKTRNKKNSKISESLKNKFTSYTNRSDITFDSQLEKKENSKNNRKCLNYNSTGISAERNKIDDKSSLLNLPMNKNINAPEKTQFFSDNHKIPNKGYNYITNCDANFKLKSKNSSINLVSNSETGKQIKENINKNENQEKYDSKSNFFNDKKFEILENFENEKNIKNFENEFNSLREAYVKETPLKNDPNQSKSLDFREGYKSSKKKFEEYFKKDKLNFLIKRSELISDVIKFSLKSSD